jgi:hypothetical protein
VIPAVYEFCPTCKKTKPLDQFSKRGKGRGTYRCLECTSEQVSRSNTRKRARAMTRAELQRQIITVSNRLVILIEVHREKFAGSAWLRELMGEIEP